MKNTNEVLEYVRVYLKMTPDDKLHRQLNYLLHISCDRLLLSFGEVTRKDVALLIESWIMSQGTHAGHETPIDNLPMRLNK